MDKLARLNDKTSGLSSMAKSAACAISGAAENAVDYVRRRGVRRMGRDLNRCVSRNPVQSMFALTAIGFLAGVLARRR
jgi:hypothetical protein